MADVVDFGTGSAVRRLAFALPAGGKTGTTNDSRDAWFIGFTPTIVTGVWVGYDQPRTIKANGYASDLAVPLWTRFMKIATRGDAPRWLNAPRGLDGDDRIRGGVFADDAERGQKKRGFWARHFGLGGEQRHNGRSQESVAAVEDYDRDGEDRDKDDKKRERRNKERERERGRRD